MKEFLPNCTDKLFKEEIDPDYGAWLKNQANNFFLYSEGYKEAGKILYEYCLKNRYYSNTLIYPLVFNYRQCIELKQKELIIMGYNYLNMKRDFPDDHSLLRLWNIYRYELLPQIDKIDEDILNNVESIIHEFNSEDPASMVFRYPVTRAPHRKESISRKTIDLMNFKNVIDKLIYFFEWQWDMISLYDDLKTEMIKDIRR